MIARPKSAVFIDAVVFEVDCDVPASPLRAVLKDESGCIICTLSAEMPIGRTHYRWHGLNDLPYGIYHLIMHHGEEETSVRMVKRI
jgi:hypothetical protein